jgi:hypothetical protein
MKRAKSRPLMDTAKDIPPLICISQFNGEEGSSAPLRYFFLLKDAFMNPAHKFVNTPSRIEALRTSVRRARKNVVDIIDCLEQVWAWEEADILRQQFAAMLHVVHLNDARTTAMHQQLMTYIRQIESRLEFMEYGPEMAALREAVNESKPVMTELDVRRIFYSTSPKLFIVGHAQHGKDDVAEYLAKQAGLRFHGSSQLAIEEFIFNRFSKKYGYKTVDECYEKRGRHRQEMHEMIWEYNQPDCTRLSRMIFSKADIYVGIRKLEELQTVKHLGLCAGVIWVDAIDRKPPEPSTSFNITAEFADYYIDNNREGDFEYLYEQIDTFIDRVGLKEA